MVLFRGHDKNKIHQLEEEVIGCAFMVIECTLTTLPETEKTVLQQKSRRVFKLGGSETLLSLVNYTLPAHLGNHVLIDANVMDFDFPLLLSLESLNQVQVKPDLGRSRRSIHIRR